MSKRQFSHCQQQSFSIQDDVHSVDYTQPTDKTIKLDNRTLCYFISKKDQNGSYKIPNLQKSLNLPVFKRYEQCSIAQPSIAFLLMGQICCLRNRFPLSNPVVVLEPILKTAFESDMCKEEGLVSALLIHMGLLKVITLISLRERKCTSCLCFTLVGSSLAKKVDLWTNLWGLWAMCVSEARLGNKMWRVEGCTPESFSLLFVKKYSSSIVTIDGNLPVLRLTVEYPII